jgi:hypothetical protein
LVKAFGAAMVDYSTTRYNIETSPFKSGGSASAALGKMVHCVVKTGRDDTGCGRWSDITFNGKDNKHITVTNAYRVYSQYADDELRPYVLDPHKQTLIDVQCFVQELQQEGDEVILFLDANQDEHQTYRSQENN